MLAAEPDRSRPAKPGLLRVTPRACGPVLPAAEPRQPDKEPWSSPCWRSSRWRRPSCGYGAGVSGPDAQPSDQLFMLAARPGSTGHGPPSLVLSTSHCVLAVLGPPAAAAPWSSTRWCSPRRWRLQPWSRSRRLRPGCSGPGSALLVGSLAGHGSPSSVSSASCRVRASPVRPAAASWSSSYWCSPRWRRAQLWSGSWRDRGVSGPGAVTGRMRATRGAVGARREPVLPAGLSARIFSGFPQGPGSAATCRLHVALIASDSRRWLSSSLAFVASTVAVVRRGHSCVTFVLETLALHAGAWRRSQRWPYIRRLGPGCSGPGH